MNTLAIKPPLGDLYNFIDKVHSYPVSAGQLLQLARRSRAPKPVIDFYKTFHGDQIFKDEDDLTSRSEQVDLMRREEDEMPPEIERGPEDY